MVRSFLNSYFGFNRQQRNGLLVLMCISLVLLIVRITYPYFMNESEIVVRYIPFAADSTQAHDSIRRFAFDPNTASEDELQRLGLTQKTAATLIKFRRHHPFTRKEDLKKVYGLSPELYEALAPYVVINERKKPGSQAVASEQRPKVNKAPHVVDLNAADSTLLESVPGIGPAFARRIIKYRTMLGGFTDKLQLREVYGITPEHYDRIRDHVEIGPYRVTTINLNRDDFKTINRHPYISYELTKAIFNARRNRDLDADGFKTLVGSDSIYSKILPYVAF
jgi:DNA uptake protein ComE-like DNA-binding protein